jgi:mRNA interferase MazF
MYAFGSIVLARFPFTDLSSSKLRPALVISRDNDGRPDIVLAFITSNNNSLGSRDAVVLKPSVANGLKVPSAVRAGKIGEAEGAFLEVAGPVFFGVFGFGRP